MKMFALVLAVSVCASNAFASESRDNEIRGKIMNMFHNAEGGRGGVSANAKVLDLAMWAQIARTNASPEYTALQLAFYVNQWNVFLAKPYRERDTQVNDFWARLLLSKEALDEIRTKPMQFNLLKVEQRRGMPASYIDAYVQIWPDLTSDAIVKFEMRQTAQGLRIYNAVAAQGSVSVFRNINASLSSLKSDPEHMREVLLSKGLVTNAQARAYRSVK